MDERNMWIDIITKLYKDLHTSDRVMHSSKESDKKRDRILNYFERLERVHQKVAQSKNPEDLKRLKNFYHNLYVIKPEDIPDSYFEHEKQIMRERGYGNIEITSERKEILVKQIIEDQEESLDRWIEYFLFDEESKSYEMWEKYWVFQGLQQLGKFNKETGKFSKRDKHTVYPFPPVEREAIFTTLKLMEDYIKDRKGDAEIRSALGSGNFKTLYEYSIKMIMHKGEKKHSSTEGKWVKYEQGSDYNILRDSLQGYYTGWCTAAGENFAKGQLENGDFYVYYTFDENGEAKIPRIAIRMDGHDTIGEIRGIAENQNMEVEMMPILDKKLEEFPDRDKYKKKEYDMQLLTTIDNKVQKGFELTKEELRFLYEIDDQIEGFGYDKDPRIEEIKSKRDLVQDLSFIFGCGKDDISIGDINASNISKLKDKVVHCGNIRLTSFSDFKGKGLKLPQIVRGSLELGDFIIALGLDLPQAIEDYLDLDDLISAEGLELPQIVGGNLILWGLTSAEGLKLPQTVGGNLILRSLTSAEGLKLPQTVGEDLNLGGLTNAKGLELPQTVEGTLDLSGLTSAEGLKLPQTVGEDLNLSGLTSAEGLELPQTVGGDLILRNLTSAEGLKLPQIVEGTLDLSGLTSAEGLELPQTVGDSLDLDRLTSAEGLKLPQTVESDIYLYNLTSAEGLELPQTIGGDLDLRGLTSAEGLVLPGNFLLDALIAPYNIIKEIENYPEKHYRNYMQNDKKEDKNSSEFTGRHFR